MGYYGNRLMREEDVEDPFVSIEDPDFVFANDWQTLQ